MQLLRTSAAATPASARCSSPATRGQEDPAATSTTTRSACPANGASAGHAVFEVAQGRRACVRLAPALRRPCARRAGSRRPGKALRRALRELPRRRPARRHRAGAAAGEPGAAEASPRPTEIDRARAASPRRCRGSPTSCRRRRSGSSSSSSTRRSSRSRAGARPRSARRESVHHAPGSLPGRPMFEADPLNLFVVVEAGDHHVTILDGDRLEPIARFPSRYALHGGPKFSPDGRYVYFASRDGWITKYDLWNLDYGGRGARRHQHAQRRGVRATASTSRSRTTCRTRSSSSTPTSTS